MQKNPFAINFGKIPQQYIDRDLMIDEITGNADISRIIQIAAVMVIAVFVLNTLNCFIGQQLEKVYYEGLNRHLEAGVGKKSMELYNYAFRTLKDGRHVLYARNGWLRTFKSGLDIINYYKIASKRNFKKVYGF